MKAFRSTSSFAAAFSALALLGTVALTGCSASDMAGPETGEIESIEAGPTANTDEHGNQNGGGTTTTAKHNTMPEDD